jgi:putative membrane protein
MPKLQLHQPQRQAPLGVIIMFFQNLRRAINFVLAVVVVNFGRDFSWLGMGYTEWGIIFAGFFLVYSFLQYRKFYFYVSGDNFVIERGVLKQEKINVPFGRIQSVNTKQNVIQRLLNLVGLKIDTAGSQQQEINIPALSKAYAKELRDYLMEKRYEHLEEAEESEEESISNNVGQREPLLRLSIADLFKVGFTQNHLRSGLILFAIVNGYIWEFEEYLIKPFEPYLEETAQTFVGKGFILFPIGLLAFVIISVIASLITTVLRYYNFSFYLGSEGLDIESGLLNRNSYNVPYEKIQYFFWESNPLRRIIGYRTLKVKQAGSQAVNERKLIGIPGLKARALLRIIQMQYPDRKSGRYTYYRPHRLLFIQRLVWLALVPSLLLSTLLYFQDLDIIFYIPIPLFFTLVVFLSYKYWRSIRIRVNAGYVEIQKGYVFPKRILVPNYKLQNLSLNQSFLQAWRGLKSFQFHTAAGTLSISHLPAEDSESLYNYLLFCIESSSEKWM